LRFNLIFTTERHLMKKILTALIFSITLCRVLNAQTTVIQGKPIAEIFTDFHLNLDDTTKTSGFAVNRAHLGYNYTPDGDFSATLIVNLCSPEELAQGTVPKRYAFFREASVSYKKDKLTVNFGMVNTRYADFQQGFWGKRYLGAEYQAQYGYGSVADLGVVADYKINDILKFDISVLNGEGYTNTQVDNSLKTAFGITITTPDNIAVRLYGDITKPKSVWQNTVIAFAGFKNKYGSLGVEASYKSNLDLIKGHNVWGISGTGAININEKSEIFMRYDYFTSVVVPGESLPWDYKKDGTYMIAGIQRTLSNNLRIALNYRRTDPYNPGQKTTNAVYINVHFKF
jgi:hypothetical protein